MEQYEKIRTVGRGAYGVVTLCRRRADNRLVIIKTIPVEEMTLEERQAALNEVKVLDMLSHPNIIAYYDSFVEDKALMIVMEYAEGGTIFEFLQSRDGELLSEDDIMYLFVQMVISLQTIHSHNILHRDLKTQNIMLDKKYKVVKIGDFGISKVLSSKSKANTVVGTPCYISPELCEGKPYNQKSDIWALGCVLYEMTSLRRAFDAPNLPALVLKIMRGTFAPISDTYSEELRKLILSMLYLDPNQRPRLSHILAQPICMRAFMLLQFEMGRMPCLKPNRLSLHGSGRGGGGRRSADHLAAAGAPAAAARRRSAQRPETEEMHTVDLITWGDGIEQAVTLETPSETEVVSVAVGRSQRLAVTSDGRLLSWKASKIRRGSTRDGDDSARPLPRVVPGLSAVVIRDVACGDAFAACLSDRGILLTFGSGGQGCLGHGDYDDVEHARIVEALLGFEISSVACGGSHIVVSTAEREVFAWGDGSHGKLGLGTDESHCRPQPVAMPAGTPGVVSVACGLDCTMFLTAAGSLLACGSNRYNKLGLNKANTRQISASSIASIVSSEEAHEPLPVQARELEAGVVQVSMGSNHSAAVTETGKLYTFGSNSHGQLGREIKKSLAESNSGGGPGIVKHLASKQVTLVSCGHSMTTAATSDGQVYVWGKCTEGRLARPAQQDSVVPLLVNLFPSRLDSALGGGSGRRSTTPDEAAALAGDIRAISSRYSATAVIRAGPRVVSSGRLSSISFA